jgi:putative transposase
LATFYKWKAPYGGLQVSKARRLRVLEAENARLKTLLADAALWGEVGSGMREFYEA